MGPGGPFKRMPPLEHAAPSIGACFFIARLMVMLPDVEKTLKSKSDETLFFYETWFFQVWPNRPILRESKAVRPWMVLTLFWVGFNGF